jgi:WD40 repeat protein
VIGPFEGLLRAATLSPDRTLLATGTADGLVRVWDAHGGRLLQEIRVGDVPVKGIAFIDAAHLAVAPETGSMLIMTLDVDELLAVARRSISRGFSKTECATYDIEPCPSLDELRSGIGAVPAPAPQQQGRRDDIAGVTLPSGAICHRLPRSAGSPT